MASASQRAREGFRSKKPSGVFLTVPESPDAYKLIASGTFVEGDLTVTKHGLVINPGSANGHENSGGSGNGDVGSAVASARLAAVPPSPPSPSSSSGGGVAGAAGSSEFGTLSLDDLTVLGTIGAGSSGVVQRVTHKQTKQTFALKLIQVEMAQQARKQLCTELRTLSGALHANVVTFHHAFTDKGCVSILMEYMDAGSLFDVLKQKKRLPEHHIATVAAQVLAGLQYLHKELRVVHRDVKPSNLLVNRQGLIKISDFGVSGQVANSMSKCATWVGTVTYMSPERISGKPYSFDSDLWSLGLTLFECAVGQFPYARTADGSSGDACESPPAPLGFWDLLDRIVTKPPPRLEEHSSFSFSNELRDLVSLSLQKEPDSRCTAAELLSHAFVAPVLASSGESKARREELAAFITGSL